MPINAQGMSESYILGFENGFKTLPTPVNGEKVPVANLNSNPNRGKFTSAALTGVPQPRQPVYGKIGVDFDFDLECNVASMATACKGLFAAPRVNSGAGTTVNVLEYGFGTMLPMFLEERHTDVGQFFLTNGAYLGHTTWSMPSEGIMTAKFGGKAAKYNVPFQVEQVSGTITDRTAYDALGYMLVRIKLNGTVIGYSKMVELTIDRKLGTEKAQDQTPDLAVVFSEIPEVTGKMSALFQDQTLFNLAVPSAGNGLPTACSLEVWIPGANGTGMFVELPTLYFRPAHPKTNGTGLCSADVEFDVYGKSGSSTIPGRARSTYLSGAQALNTQTLIVAPDGGGTQTFTFVTGDNTVDLLAARINATATGMTASVDRQPGDTGGVLRIESGTKGSTSSIQVTGGTANTTLKFPTSAITGRDNESVWVSILSPLTT